MNFIDIDAEALEMKMIVHEVKRRAQFLKGLKEKKMSKNTTTLITGVLDVIRTAINNSKASVLSIRNPVNDKSYFAVVIKHSSLKMFEKYGMSACKLCDMPLNIEWGHNGIFLDADGDLSSKTDRCSGTFYAFYILRKNENQNIDSIINFMRQLFDKIERIETCGNEVNGITIADF